MNDVISRQALFEYALSQKDKSVTPNDIMRFPSAQSQSSEELDSIQLAIDFVRERLRANGYTNVALVSELNRTLGFLMRLQADKQEGEG